MDYKVRPADAEEARYFESRNNGYGLYEDEHRYYSVFINDGRPDPTTWATLNNHGERDMPIFTEEYCRYQGITRQNYDTITII